MGKVEIHPDERERCFYCSALVAQDSGKGDHFPIPREAGGRLTVPCCSGCHEMKDRFILRDWPAEWISKIVEDFPRMSRETKIFLAKVFAVYARKYIKQTKLPL